MSVLTQSSATHVTASVPSTHSTILFLDHMAYVLIVKTAIDWLVPCYYMQQHAVDDSDVLSTAALATTLIPPINLYQVLQLAPSLFAMSKR